MNRYLKIKKQWFVLLLIFSVLFLAGCTLELPTPESLITAPESNQELMQQKQITQDHQKVDLLEDFKPKNKLQWVLVEVLLQMEKKCEDKECCTEDKKETKECKDRKYLRREFAYTKSRQTLALPDTADRENIEACVKHGILHITIPKLQHDKIASETKVIEVK